MTSPAVSPSEPKIEVLLEKCRCGYERSHRRVRPQNIYGILGMLGAIAGAGGVPKEVRWVCADCDAVFARSTDRAVRMEHR